MSANRSHLWKLLSDYKVEVPILQRDYAQGRDSRRVTAIRENILKAVCGAVKDGEEPLELDFIYGYIKQNPIHRVFCPLDGQQRLTTLFLFYWYVAAREGCLDEAVQRNLSKFTYEVRHSSREFCAQLVKFQPESFNEPIKDNIRNQPWFFAGWHHDPTIHSMLTMLNSIQKHVSEFELENIWATLITDQPPIVFHLLSMEAMGQPDDLYIKMNSRGKELTDFEHFKARFAEFLKEMGRFQRFNSSIDSTWTDLFWERYKDDSLSADIANKVDAAFMRFFKYASDMIAAGMDEDILATAGGSIDEFDEYLWVYSKSENVDRLFSILDMFVGLYKDTPDFFSSFFYSGPDNYSPGKTRLFITSSLVDLFKNCIDKYDASLRNNPFTIGEQLMLYACILHKEYQTEEFPARIRKLRNLITNSEDTVRREFIPSLLKSVFEVIVNDNLDTESKFSTAQIQEENEKTAFVRSNPNMRDTVCRLEDHHLLQGCIAIFDLDTNLTDYAKQFRNVFYMEKCDYSWISRALMTFGDYSQQPNDWSIRFGNYNDSTWRELFTPSIKRKGFFRTKTVLNKMLDSLNQLNSSTVKDIVELFLEQYGCEQDREKGFNYYFVKYEGFRRNEDGYYYWPDKSKQYSCIMMRRKTLGGFFWNPFLYQIKMLVGTKLQLENTAPLREYQWGAPLVLVKSNAEVRMSCYEEGYSFEALNEEGKDLLEKAYGQGMLDDHYACRIRQTSEGVDLVDRVVIGVDLVEWLLH